MGFYTYHRLSNPLPSICLPVCLPQAAPHTSHTCWKEGMKSPVTISASCVTSPCSTNMARLCWRVTQRGASWVGAVLCIQWGEGEGHRAQPSAQKGAERYRAALGQGYKTQNTVQNNSTGAAHEWGQCPMHKRAEGSAEGSTWSTSESDYKVRVSEET